MHPTIRTKWHKLRPLLEKNEVYFTAPPDGISPPATEFGYNPNMIKLLLDVGDTLPKFVIDPELTDMAIEHRREYMLSLMDMKRAGVMRLPFPALIVELPMQRNRHACVLIRDLSHKELFRWEGPEVMKRPEDYPKDMLQFYGYPMRIDWDDNGEYLVVSPSVQYIGLTEKNGEATLGFAAAPINLINEKPADTEKLTKFINATYKKDTAESWTAVYCALLLMRTTGVEKQVIEVNRLNKRRQLTNKPPIPTHTYVHIGKVYRSVGDKMIAEDYVPRRSPRPHWRRGHNRHVRFGPGRTQIKLKYFEPILVAFHDDPTDGGTAMRTPEYVVKD